MVTKQLTLQISGKTEDDIANIILGLINVFKDSAITVLTNDGVDASKFDWSAEVVVANNSDNVEQYYSLADELYAKLINNNKAFSDWEYKFISDMYAASEEKRFLTPKQKDWIIKLKEKYL